MAAGTAVVTTGGRAAEDDEEADDGAVPVTPPPKLRARRPGLPQNPIPPPFPPLLLLPPPPPHPPPPQQRPSAAQRALRSRSLASGARMYWPQRTKGEQPGEASMRLTHARGGKRKPRQPYAWRMPTSSPARCPTKEMRGMTIWMLVMGG
jgi:hypothetical protein